MKPGTMYTKLLAILLLVFYLPLTATIDMFHSHDMNIVLFDGPDIADQTLDDWSSGNEPCGAEIFVASHAPERRFEFKPEAEEIEVDLDEDTAPLPLLLPIAFQRGPPTA